MGWEKEHSRVLCRNWDTFHALVTRCGSAGERIGVFGSGGDENSSPVFLLCRMAGKSKVSVMAGEDKMTIGEFDSMKERFIGFIACNDLDWGDGTTKAPRSKKKAPISFEESKAFYAKQVNGWDVNPADRTDFMDVSRNTYARIVRWMFTRTPIMPSALIDTVLRMPEQLSYEQYLELKRRGMTYDDIVEILGQLHNSDHHRKKTSVYLTLMNWFKIRQK